ncbi:MAG: zinc ribbon domain-containing protein [Clostridiales Family XIII bacterium]|jgi:hypothetical protein|nr:zinc ribbon domain-containing protein [Clostridiales Family XIII bacterium]
MNSNFGKQPWIVAVGYSALMIVLLLCPWVMTQAILGANGFYSLILFDRIIAVELSGGSGLSTVLFFIGIAAAVLLLQSAFTGLLTKLSARVTPIAFIVITLLFLTVVRTEVTQMNDYYSGLMAFTITMVPVLVLILSAVFVAVFAKPYIALGAGAAPATPAFSGEAAHAGAPRPQARPFAKPAAPDFFGEGAAQPRQFCTACGAANKTDSSFCEQCGAPLAGTPPQNT